MRATTALAAALAAAAFLAAFLPAGASAAAVTREAGVLVYTAAAGMTNNVHVMAAQDGSDDHVLHERRRPDGRDPRRLRAGRELARRGRQLHVAVRRTRRPRRR